MATPAAGASFPPQYRYGRMVAHGVLANAVAGASNGIWTQTYGLDSILISLEGDFVGQAQILASLAYDRPSDSDNNFPPISTIKTARSSVTLDQPWMWLKIQVIQRDSGSLTAFFRAYGAR